MAGLKTAALFALVLAALVVCTLVIQTYYVTNRVDNTRPTVSQAEKDPDAEPEPEPEPATEGEAKSECDCPELKCPQTVSKPDLKRCLVAFVMFNNRSLDYFGSLRHAESIPYIYPGCRMILYYDDASVDPHLINQLKQMNVTVVNFNHKMLVDMGWNTTQHAFRVVRYWALNRLDWDYIMFRDLDSGVFFREKTAVEEWLNSGLPFHFMRDHPGHWWAIMGGLWGLHREGLSLLPFNFTKALQRFVTERTNVTTTDWAKWTDQKFLNEEVFPIAQKYAMAHDSYYCTIATLQSKIIWGFPTKRVGKLVAGHFTMEDGSPMQIDGEVPEAPVECRRNKEWKYG